MTHIPRSTKSLPANDNWMGHTPQSGIKDTAQIIEEAPLPPTQAPIPPTPAPTPAPTPTSTVTAIMHPDALCGLCGLLEQLATSQDALDSETFGTMDKETLDSTC